MRWKASRTVLSLFVLFLLLAVLPATLAAQELYLDNALVTGGQGATLSSIGLLTGSGDSSSLRKLLATQLPELASHPAIIPARELQTKLEPLIGQAFVLVGGPIVYLPSTVASSGERSFFTGILQSIQRSLPGTDLRVEVWTDKGESPSRKELHGSLEFRFPAGDNSPQALASNSYILYKRSDDASFRTLPIHIRIEAFVPVATVDIPNGSEFSSSKVSYKLKDITSLSGVPAKLRGSRYTASSGISAGEVIYSYMASKVNAVTAGKQIRIAFRKGSVEVSVLGTAYQSGALGDTISVAPSSTGRRYEGTIVSPTEVVVEN